MQGAACNHQDRRLWAYLLLGAAIVLCYSNTFDAGWQLDDDPNILHNARLHIDALSIDALKRAFTALPSDPGNTIWRPLSCLSLALNWYWGQDDPVGYHLVNTFFHLVTACFLFLTVRLLLTAPRLNSHLSPPDMDAVALLSALLWAVNPVQTQAVTYIIQRMAVMAAMFTIIGLYAYLRFRLAAPERRGRWFVAVIVAFVGALLSKENAILFPLSAALIEFVFFEPYLAKKVRPLMTTRNLIIGGILIAAAAALVLNLAGNPINFAHYDKRPFSLWERVISQPRILLFYLSLLAYPAPWRLSIEHDIHHSLSLFDPWTTLPAMVAVILLIGGAFWRIRRLPLLSFGILFFFLNHMVESTVLPLELVFEHRNYLPSFFLFVPLALAIHRLLARYRKESSAVCILLIIGGSVCLGVLGLACHERNKAWTSAYTLWFDAARKAPGRARPLMALGVSVGWGDEKIANRYDVALGIFQRALPLATARKNETAQLHGNIALAQMNRGKIGAAVDAFERALQHQPDNRKIRYDYLEMLINTAQWDAADAQADRLIAGEGSLPADLNYKGVVRLWMGKPGEALELFQRAIAAGLQDPFVYHNIGATMTELGHLQRGRWFLRRALQLAEEDSRGKMMIYFSLIENRHDAGDNIAARGVAYGLLARYGLDEVVDTLNGMHHRYMSPPLDLPLVSRLLAGYLAGIASTVGSLADPVMHSVTTDEATSW